MNKLIIALSLVCAVADVGARHVDPVTNPWFSALADDPETPSISGGTFTTGGESGVVPDISEGKFVIDSDEKTVKFTPTGIVSVVEQEMVTISFELDTAIVPHERRGTLENVKVAFAASEDDDVKSYYAWLGSGWTKLGGTPLNEGAPYNLTMSFKGVQVKFTVDGEDLGDGWYDYTSTAVPHEMTIEFDGCGKVASFSGEQQAVEAEIVHIEESVLTVAIKETDVTKFSPGATELETYFKSQAKGNFTGFEVGGITIAEAYALGLIVDNGGTMTAVNGGRLTASAIAESTDTEKITFKMNVKPLASADTGVFVDYQVVDETDGGDPTPVPGLTILKPDSPGFNKYKVQAVLKNTRGE